MTRSFVTVLGGALFLGACMDGTTAPSAHDSAPTRHASANVAPATTPAPPSDWADVYDPFVLRAYHVALTEADYQTIRHDETFDIKVPARFWLEGDTDNAEYLITIRRKSATPIGDKISYRIAFQSQVNNASVKRFYDIKSFSLENGDDQDVLSEGLAWYMHRLASNATYQPGLAAWATLTLHIDTGDGIDVRPQGVYLNVELPDKHFLRHRGVWSEGSTWLYKQDDIGLPELKEPEIDAPTAAQHSAAYNYLAYSPFRTDGGSSKGKKGSTGTSTPSDAVLYTDLTRWIDMDGMLRLGAVNAFTDNPDDLFTHGKNFFWADFPEHVRTRMYFPWDLDASIRSTTGGIYGSVSAGKRGKTTVSQHPYQSVILNHPTFRTQYNSIMLDLLNGPMSSAAVHAALDNVLPVVRDALIADPNSKITDPDAKIAALKLWVTAREANVRQQVQANNTPAPR
jgi:hypothetical protein